LKQAALQVAKEAVDVAVATKKKKTAVGGVAGNRSKGKEAKTEVGEAAERDATNRIDVDAIVEGEVVRTTSNSKKVRTHA
jgi:hypothetical protein